MKNLEEARAKINEIDKKMAELFCERMKEVKNVALYKKSHGLKVFDEKREKFLIDKNSSFIEDSLLKSYYIPFLKSEMNISKQYQHALLDGMKIACCGVKGAFADIAAEKIFPDGNIEFYNDFSSTYKSVEEGICDCCVLPIENSYAGNVTEVTDLIFKGSLYINGVYDLEICHNLLGIENSEIKDIKTVLSHPQALNQCEGYINLHNLKKIKCENTAIAAKKVAKSKDKSIAAIASIETAGLYGLKVLEKNINESSYNTTRFAVFSRTENETNKPDNKFFMVFAVKNEAGALAKAINIIGEFGFNMRSLRSRPIKNEPWQYYFFVEAEGNPHGENAKKMLDKLSAQCTKAKIAGSFEEEENI